MIYIHVPFCKSFCTYCGFYSELCRPGGRDAEFYADAVCREAERRRNDILSTAGVNTLYIGGGTPSVLPSALLEKMVRALPFPPGGYDEFTVEVNPDDLTPAYAEFLLSLGVNRLSMGVQSFNDDILRWMNRRHSVAGAIRAFRTARSAGFANISLDLIFGLPLRADGSVVLADTVWLETIDGVLGLGPEHISCYQLSVEKGSALETMIEKGSLREAPQELCRAQYDLLCSRLAAAGYQHYEVSNFALPGHKAVHNSAYWSGAPYVGLGPGAHSYDGARRRTWNSETIPGYTSEGETLSDKDLSEERIMLSLRTAAGIPLGELRRIAAPAALDAALARGLLVTTTEADSTEPRVRIPEPHFFISDSIIASLVP